METTEKLEERKPVTQSIDFYKIFRVFLSRWYWILGCVVIALLIAKISIQYTTNLYQTFGHLRFKETNPDLNLNNTSSAQVYNYTDKIQAEGYTIRSQEVLESAARRLNYRIAYFYKNRWTTSEVYPYVPFKINIIKQDSLNFNNGQYQVQPESENTFSLLTPQDPKGKPKIYRYGQPISEGNMIFSITSKIPKSFLFKFNSIGEIAQRLQSVGVDEAARFTNVMRLSLTDQNATFAADGVNAVMQEYVKYDMRDKRKSAKQMVDFIDKQLGFITNKVDSSGDLLRDYKIKNDLLDLTMEASNTSNSFIDAQAKKKMATLERIGIDQLVEQLRQGQGKLQPNFMLEGPVSALLGGLITNFNGLIESREKILMEGYGGKSAAVQGIDDRIAQVKTAINNSIASLVELNDKTQRALDKEIQTLSGKKDNIPSQEQDFRKLQNTYEVNEKVRTLLNERKIEAQLKEAAVVPGVEIVNLAYPNFNVISNDVNKTYATALLGGLAAGFGLILLVRFLNPYIYDKETVESLTRTPIIGVIRKFPEYIDKNNRQALSLSKPKSVFAESVRSVRTNLSFMASHKKSKTICITSEVSGEGKSFVTVNLAGTLALIDKKVILIAADLRKSKLHKAFGSNNKVGLSTYLSGQAELGDVIVHDDVHNIDFMPSGPVPPNPSELLHSERMKELLTTLTPKYDYVLVDTAPVGLVSDAIPLIRQSDVNLFVIRSGKSQFRAAAIPERLSREYGLSNLAIVLNAFGDDALHANYYTTDYSRGGGNSTYYYSDYSGYAGSGYYDNDPKKWWEFWKKK